MHIPFGSMVKFQYLAQFSVDLLLCQVAFSLVLILPQFSVFTYYMINPLVSITTLVILLDLIYFCFNIVCPQGVILHCY